MKAQTSIGESRWRAVIGAAAALATALAIGACGATAPAQTTPPGRDGSGNGTVSGSAASCAALPKGAIGHARTVIEGVFLHGPSVTGRPHTLFSPARFRVVHWLRGHGRRIVKVTTGLQRRGSTIIGNGEGITPVAGQRWLIVSQSRHSPYDTSDCEGSRPIRRHSPWPTI